MADNKKKAAPSKKGALSEEQLREKRLTIITPVVSVLLALIIGAIIIACLGKNPITGYAAMLKGSLGISARLARRLSVPAL